jgi:hypothetical protein
LIAFQTVLSPIALDNPWTNAAGAEWSDGGVAGDGDFGAPLGNAWAT